LTKEFISRLKIKFDINEIKEKRKTKRPCKRIDFKKIQVPKKDRFLKKVFNHLQNKLETGETLYRFCNCLCDGMLKLQGGNILLEVKGGKLNWGSQCIAITQLMIASKWIKDKWNENVDGYWIVAEDFTSSQDWGNTLDYALEYHRFVKGAFGFDIRLMQYKDNQLIEIVS